MMSIIVPAEADDASGAETRWTKAVRYGEGIYLAPAHSTPG